MFLYHQEFFPNLLFLIAVVHFSSPNVSSASNDADTIQQLVAEPDYRAVRLRWQYLSARRLQTENERPLFFIIRYCELAQWQSKKRCKEQRLPVDPEQLQQQESNEFKARSLASVESDDAILSSIRVIASEREREEHRDFQRTDFEVTLANLRMLTKYSISVRADLPGFSPSENHQKHRRGAEIFVQTKSFAAKTSRCLANSSIIEVNTGPYFGGKISVEGATPTSEEGGCARFGNRSSTQSTYTLAIDHQICGSKIINKTRIETMVIVHENRDILTHNSRRYLVLCTFTPQLYSLTASASVPTHLLRRVIDRLREKRLPFQLEVVGTSEAKAKTEKLKKRHSLNTTTKQSFDGGVMEGQKSVASHLRDSRMLADGSGVGMVKNLNRKDDQNMSSTAAKSTSFSSLSVAVTISTIFCLTAAAALAAFLAQKHGNKEAALSSRKEGDSSDEKTEVVMEA